MILLNLMLNLNHKDKLISDANNFDLKYESNIITN